MSGYTRKFLRALGYLGLWLTVTIAGGVLGGLLPILFLGTAGLAPSSGLMMMVSSGFGLLLGCIGGQAMVFCRMEERNASLSAQQRVQAATHETHAP